MDLYVAERAVRRGWIAGSLSAVATVGVMLLAMSSQKSEKLAYWNNPSVLVDVGLILLLSFGIWRRSLWAAVLMLVYHVVARVLIAMDTGSIGGIGLIAALFAYIYLRAVQGAWVLRKLRQEKRPASTPLLSWWGYYVWPGLLAVLALSLVASLTNDEAVQADAEQRP